MSWPSSTTRCTVAKQIFEPFDGCSSPAFVHRRDVPGSCSSARNDLFQINLIPHCVEFIMRRSNWTPSIVPNDNDETVYLVADDFGRLGRAWREADYETTDLETVIQDLLTGQYSNPSASSPSTPPNVGRKTFPKMSPANCAVAAICRCANSLFDL